MLPRLRSGVSDVGFLEWVPEAADDQYCGGGGVFFPEERRYYTGMF